MTGVRAVEPDRRPEVRHAAAVLVVAHGRTGADLLRELAWRRGALSAAAGRPLEISAVHSVTAPLQRAVLGAALRMVDSVRPEIVVEAVDDAEAAILLAQHALRRGASVVTASAALLGTAGPALRALAADQGQCLHAEGALGYGIPVGRLLGETLRHSAVTRVVGFVRHEGGASSGDGSTGPASCRAAHRTAALAATAFMTGTTTGDVVVEGLGGCAAHVPADAGLCSVSSCERAGGRIAARVYPALVPGFPLFGRWRGWFSALLVDTVDAGTLLFPHQARARDRVVEMVLRDLVRAVRPGAPATGSAEPGVAPQGGHFLLVADARHARAGQALVADLAARGVATRACRLDPRHHELHLITERIPDPVLAHALRDLEPGSIRTEAVAGGWSGIGALLR